MGTVICVAEYSGASKITLGSILYVVPVVNGVVDGFPGTT